MSRVVSIGHFPFPIPRAKRWDGSTYTTPDFTNPQVHQPSPDCRVYCFPCDGSQSTYVSGPGTFWPIPVTLDQACQIFWRVKNYTFDAVINWAGPVYQPSGTGYLHSSTGGPQNTMRGDSWSNLKSAPSNPNPTGLTDERSLILYPYPQTNDGPQIGIQEDGADDYLPGGGDNFLMIYAGMSTTGFVRDETGQWWWSGLGMSGDSDFFGWPAFFSYQLHLYISHGTNGSIGDGELPDPSTYTLAGVTTSALQVSVLGFRQTIYDITDLSPAATGNGSSTTPGSGSITIAAREYWPYADGDGVALYDTTTGARL